jgi:hypothetical protein
MRRNEIRGIGPRGKDNKNDALRFVRIFWYFRFSSSTLSFDWYQRH